MKHTKKLLAVILSLVMALSVGVVAFAEEGEANWVRVKTDADEIADGEMYLALTAIEPGLVARWTQENIYDLVPANNAGRLAVDYYKTVYADEWADAVAQIKAENPGLTDESFDGGWPMYNAEDIFLPVIAENYGVDTSWPALEAKGEALLPELYPGECAEAVAQAETRMADYKAAEWYVDFTFTERPYIKAVQNGEEVDLFGSSDEVFDSLTKDVDWQVVSYGSEGLADGDYYIDVEDIRALAAARYAEMPDDAVVPSFDPATGTVVERTKAELIEAAVEDFLANMVISVNPAPAEDELFAYRLTQTETHPMTGETATMDIYYPLAEKTWFDAGSLTAEKLDGMVKQYEAPEDPVDPGEDPVVDPDQPVSDADICAYCGKSHPRTFLGSLIRLVHTVLYFFKTVFGLTK